MKLGDSVWWIHSSGSRKYKGKIVGWNKDKYYAYVDDGTGRPPQLVRADRLRKQAQA